MANMWRFILEALYAYRLPKKTTSPRAGSTAGVRIVLSINAAALSELDTRSILSDTYLAAKEKDRKSTRLNSSHSGESRMPSSA